MEVIESVAMPPEILFIPGFKSKNVPDDEYRSMLKSVFPDSAIEIMKWESNLSLLDWPQAMKLAELSVKGVVEKIERMEAEKRDNLVLIGHSLGGRMAIRTLARLADKNMRIRRGIFLAAAIPDDDEDIEKAVQATNMPCINISNREDHVLRELYGVVGENDLEAHLKGALGAYGSLRRLPSLSMLEIKVVNGTGNVTNHNAQYYFAELSRCISDTKLLTSVFPPMKVRRGSIENNAWETICQKDRWKLCSHGLTGQCKIESPWGSVVMMDDSNVIWPLYESLEEDLVAVNRYNSLKITVDNEVKPVKVIPFGIDRVAVNLGFKWETEEEYEGWLLQRKEVPFVKKAKTYRVVDNRDILRAQGDEDSMKKTFEKIKAQLGGQKL